MPETKDLAPEAAQAKAAAAGQLWVPSAERGTRASPENAQRYLMRQWWVDPDTRAAILDIRHMDRLDPRVKRVHSKISRTAVKGGLRLKTPSAAKTLQRRWARFVRRLGLDRQTKLESDCRGLVMEGNLPLQWVLADDQRSVALGLRMPTETIVPQVDETGRFVSAEAAYKQYDLVRWSEVATFALWQLSLVRLTPDSEDDMGALGRPYLDASRSVWRKLVMTEDDLVIRRRTRAPQRFVHALEGADQDELRAYEEKNRSQAEDGNWSDFYLNRKGGVTAVGGDANLDQIRDVVYLLDAFFSGAPAPKELFGYAGDVNRDVLEDLKRDFFDEIDAIQDTLSYVYELGFRLELLLNGVNPDAQDFEVKFAERRTDTPNQRADLALKHQALGMPPSMVWESAGVDAAEAQRRRDEELTARSAYPDPGNINAQGRGRAPVVSITPGNARRGESGTDISTATASSQGV